jgi:hypothetical protein
MGVLMVIFWMNFAGGVVAAIRPLAYASFGFKMGFALSAGLAAGSWLGRALRTFMQLDTAPLNGDDAVF